MTGVEPCCERADRLLGDRAELLVGYGNGVCALGACVYDARYKRSVGFAISARPTLNKLDTEQAEVTYLECTRLPGHNWSRWRKETSSRPGDKGDEGHTAGTMSGKEKGKSFNDKVPTAPRRKERETRKQSRGIR